MPPKPTRRNAIGQSWGTTGARAPGGIRRYSRGRTPAVPRLGGADAGVDDVDVEAEDEHPAAPAEHPLGVLGASGDDPPGLAGLGAGPGDPLDGVEALGVLEVAGDAQHLADVGRADEEEVDVGDRGDLGDRGDRPGGLDLDADEGLGVGLGDVLGQRHQAEPAVAVAAVHPPLAPGVELGPADGLLGVLGASGHADHHAAGPGLERTHDRGVIGRRLADEVVEPVVAGGHRGQLDVLHPEPGVLGVEPEGVEAAVLADDLDQLGREELADPEHPDELALGEKLLDLRHRRVPRGRPIGRERSRFPAFAR